MTKFSQTYVTDLKYTEWMLIAEFFPPRKMGSPLKWEIWQIINAILYVNRMGCQWRMMPQNCVIAGIVRHGEIVMPRGVTAPE